jgi:fructokinase
MKKDITFFGDSVIDFTPLKNSDEDLENIETFKKNPGGSALNSCFVSKYLGINSSFCGKAGEDVFGKYLKNLLDKHNIENSNFILDKEYKTALAFVSYKNFEPSFLIYKMFKNEPLFNFDEIDINKLIDTKFFHFGSFISYYEKNVDFFLKLLKILKEKGVIISFDPNIRKHKIEKDSKTYKAIFEYFEYADIIKMSNEDFLNIFKNSKYDEFALSLDLKNKDKIFILTLGKDGQVLYYKDKKITNKIEKYPVIDTIGAGDSYSSAFLSKLVNLNFYENREILDEKVLKEIMEFSSTISKKCCESFGALGSFYEF